MARPYKLSWFYQNDEEVLTASIWYFNPDPDALDVADLSTIAQGVITRVAANLDGEMADNVHSHGCRVTTPAVDTEGPARFIAAHGMTMEGIPATPIMDSIVVNLVLKGDRADGTPATGGIRLSGLPVTVVDKNQLDSTWTSAILAAFQIIFPPTIALATGEIHRAIRSKRKLFPLEFVYPTTMEISDKVGINLTRVGNRPQSNAGPLEVEV